MLLPNNRRQHRTLHIQKDVLPYALCWFLWPMSAALASIFRMDSTSTSYIAYEPGVSLEYLLLSRYSPQASRPEKDFMIIFRVLLEPFFASGGLPFSFYIYC